METDDRRVDIIEELYNRYGRGGSVHGFKNRLRFWRKKYLWSLVVGAAKFLKRTLDIGVSATMFVALSPLFLAVVTAIKLTDGGPILFWQTRVGKWGREFPFPKFRSMVVDAETIKDSILDQSHHEDSITFKTMSLT